MVLTDKLNRAATLAIASLLFLASLVPLLTRQRASAYTLLGDRQIKMSSSVGSATGVTYEVEFKLASTHTNLEGIVVSFCENSPIIEDTVCDRPAGFSLAAGNVTAPAVAGDIDVSGWTDVYEDHASAAGAANTLTLSDTTGLAGAIGDTVRFNITGVVNPTAINASFFARIYTYTDSTFADGYTLANPNVVGASMDAGGIALSTAEQITVTAKVQERITFCVYTYPTVESAPNAGDWTESAPDPVADNNCGGKMGSSVILGDENGVLASDRSFVDKTSYFSITTNAASDAVVRLKGDTLSNGSATIPAIGDTPTGSQIGQEQFGFCLHPYSSGNTTLAIADGTDAAPDNVDYTGTDALVDCSDTVQSARLATAPAAGADDNGALFAFDTANTTTTFGQVIARKQAGPYTTARIAFIGNISDITQPGIYRTTLTFIATGTY